MGAAMVGWAHLPFGRLDGMGLEDLITRAGREALQHAGIDGTVVDGVWLGNLNGGFTPDVFCLLYTSPSPRDRQKSRMPSSA